MFLQLPSDQHPSQRVIDDILHAVSGLLVTFRGSAAPCINYKYVSSANQRNLLKPKLDVEWCTLVGSYYITMQCYVLFLLLWPLHDLYTTFLWHTMTIAWTPPDGHWTKYAELMPRKLKRIGLLHDSYIVNITGMGIPAGFAQVLQRVRVWVWEFGPVPVPIPN